MFGFKGYKENGLSEQFKCRVSNKSQSHVNSKGKSITKTITAIIIFPRTTADHSSLPLYPTHVELLQAPASARSCRYFWRSASVKPFLGDL